MTPIATIASRRWIHATPRDDAIENAQGFEDLLRARLDAFAPRAAKGRVLLLDQSKSYASSGEINCKRKSGRAGAADQNISHIVHRHALSIYVYDAHNGGTLWPPGSDCKPHIFRL